MSIKFFRSIPELDSNLFSVDFHIENDDDVRVLCGLSNEQSIPKTKDDWIRQLNEIYCQSISLECEYIEVNYHSSDDDNSIFVSSSSRMTLNVFGSLVDLNNYVHHFLFHLIFNEGLLSRCENVR
jgi:hypothetical protein